MRATNARTEPMTPMREYVYYSPLSRICAQNTVRMRAFALRIARRPHAVARRTYVTSGECEPVNVTGRVLDELPLHLQGQELVQELVRGFLSKPFSVVNKREKLLVGAAKVEIWVIGQLEDAQIEERRDAHPSSAIQSLSSVDHSKFYFWIPSKNFPTYVYVYYTYILILI